MAHTALLISEYADHARSLRNIISTLQFEVRDAACDGVAALQGMSFTLAVLDMPMHQMESALPTCRERRLASKVLALVPFEVQGMETHLVGLGADDVLALPVSRPRLEVTVKNLLRLHELECAADDIRNKAAL